MAAALDPRLQPTGDLISLLRCMHEASVDYVVCGGVACVLHGVSRTTQYIDLFIRLDEDNIDRFLRAVRSLRMVPRAPVKLDDARSKAARDRWGTEKDARVFTIVSEQSPCRWMCFSSIRLIMTN